MADPPVLADRVVEGADRAVEVTERAPGEPERAGGGAEADDAEGADDRERRVRLQQLRDLVRGLTVVKVVRDFGHAEQGRQPRTRFGQ